MTAVTDSGGVVVERYAYEAYGKTTVLDANRSVKSSQVPVQPYGFTGRRMDYEEGSGLYFYRLRYYDPEAGRFVSRDPLGMWGDAGQRGNAQNYCGNNPVNRLDPLGLNATRDVLQHQLEVVNAGIEARRNLWEIMDRAGDRLSEEELDYYFETNTSLNAVNVHREARDETPIPLFDPPFSDERREFKRGLLDGIDALKAIAKVLEDQLGRRPDGTLTTSTTTGAESSEAESGYKYDLMVFDVIGDSDIKAAAEAAKARGLSVFYSNTAPDDADSLRRVMAEGRVLAFNAHGNAADGIQAVKGSNTKWLNPGELAAAGGGVVPEAVHLSSCEGLSLARSFKTLGVGSAYATDQLCNPTTAVKYTIALINALGAGQSVESAGDAAYSAGARFATNPNRRRMDARGFPEPVR